MSAGVCGKRVGFEEIFGSSSTSSKRSRCSTFGSPVRSSDFGSGSDDSVSVLLQMFPNLDREMVETVLRTHNNKIEDAIESLHALSLGDTIARNESQGLDSAMMGNNDTGPAQNGQTTEQKVEDVQDLKSMFEFGNAMDGSKWVDLFVHEMMNATDLSDARARAARILEAFEKNVVSHSMELKELEHASLKEHLQNFLRDNQILKRAVAIQHDRNLEQEERAREVQQLKDVIRQYQEQVRALELNNYTLKLHLQRAQGSSSIPGQFHPDIF
ncbi:uncharacterized protein LOC100247807 isoform X2 [Vitis vinifera]|uniref:uncharacterized protein LOC100247807 isoform X2 n=1 Tax=Vitis vinifera TaxID=29760 RepID=UPI0001983CF6|nr:uncharacterized protein LOC100247807 isoform X2 [Vitis vinifera]|eukprot:XP_010654304.1 PREDICTED: uncharacterized protein LOC100247807 isoform X2 [Vitis vinifera]